MGWGASCCARVAMRGHPPAALPLLHWHGAAGSQDSARALTPTYPKRMCTAEDCRCGTPAFDDCAGAGLPAGRMDFGRGLVEAGIGRWRRGLVDVELDPRTNMHTMGSVASLHVAATPPSPIVPTIFPLRANNRIPTCTMPLCDAAPPGAMPVMSNPSSTFPRRSATVRPSGGLRRTSTIASGSRSAMVPKRRVRARSSRPKLVPAG